MNFRHYSIELKSSYFARSNILQAKNRPKFVDSKPILFEDRHGDIIIVIYEESYTIRFYYTHFNKHSLKRISFMSKDNEYKFIEASDSNIKYAGWIALGRHLIKPTNESV